MSKPATIVAPRASHCSRAAPDTSGNADCGASCRRRGTTGRTVAGSHFHVVFTLPAPIAAMAFQNKGDVYAILFKSAVEAVTTLAANPNRLGAKIGGLAILHTWG
jgi:hypothetical protein